MEASPSPVTMRTYQPKTGGRSAQQQNTLISSGASDKQLMTDLPIQVKFCHVDGHQDDIKHFEDLELESQLNVKMDEMAKHHVTHIISQKEAGNSQVCSSDVAGEGWQCWVDGEKQTSDPAHAVRKSQVYPG